MHVPASSLQAPHGPTWLPGKEMGQQVGSDSRDECELPSARNLPGGQNKKIYNGPQMLSLSCLTLISLSGEHDPQLGLEPLALMIPDTNS